MPPAVWTRLVEKKWFRKKLLEAAMFWVKLMFTMTAMVTIQPLAVTFVYDGDIKNDSSGLIAPLGIFFTIGQFVILFYGLYEMARHTPEKIKKRVQQVKNHGLKKGEQILYGDVPLNVLVEDKVNVSKKHRIKSLRTDKDLDLAASVLADAFRDDKTLSGYIDSKEGKLSFYQANVKSVACFNHVLACFDENLNYPETRPACVMACIPVFSKSQEEITVFATYEAWVLHGYSIPGATETDFPLPSDDLFELGELKYREKHGLTKTQYILIAHFGADPVHKGKGYGRSMAKYIIGVSESKKVPLVLEATTVPNREHYQRYGFKVVDCCEGNPDWVLMIRYPGQSHTEVV